MLHLSPAITAYFIALAAVLGLVMGSFLNCMAWRLCHGESVLRGRSHCPSCGHTLGAADLVPVFSWLFLKRRCRYCHAPVSVRYLLAELFTAVLFVSVVLRLDVSLVTLQYLVLASLLLICSLTDMESGIIPDRFILAGIVSFVLFTCLTSENIPKALLWGLIDGLSVSLPLLLLVLLADRVLKKETMGGGDIKLLFMLGLYFDWKYNIIILLLACVIGIIIALIKQKRAGSPFAFGPAIALAAWLTFLFGERALSWYLSLF